MNKPVVGTICGIFGEVSVVTKVTKSTASYAGIGDPMISRSDSSLSVKDWDMNVRDIKQSKYFLADMKEAYERLGKIIALVEGEEWVKSLT